MCFLVLPQCSRTLNSQSRVTIPVLTGPVPGIEVSSKGGGEIFSACSETYVVDPDPQQMDKQDPDPHQSDKLDPDQFADEKPKF